VRAAAARLPFVLSASFVITACALLVRTEAFMRNADMAAWGVTFDLTITVPLLYWFFVVRPRKAPAMTLAPVFMICTILAAAVVPRANQQFLRDLSRFAVPAAELLLIGAIVHRLRRGSGENAIRRVLGDNRIADLVESELMMLAYAFGGWWMKPAEPEGRAITFHERSGWGTILAGILVLLTAEGLGMHLLLGQWSTTAAWVWTALDLWAAAWLLGDYHAMRLRRSDLTADSLHLRLGMRWQLSVPLTSIESIEAVGSEEEWKRRGVLKAAMLDEPRWLVTLREPMVARGIAGLRKEVRAIAMLPDEDDAISGLRTAVSAAGTRAALR
jgi:hypothetical protein